MNASDTIYALSSGALPSGVAVLRISGAGSGMVLETLFGSIPAPRRLAYGPIGRAERPIDMGMVVFFPGPASATGEDCAELHLHGSVAVLKAAKESLASIPGLREAEPGEFTLRAFHHGRMDLTEVESLSHLIEAETEAQRLQALSGVNGAIRDACLAWRARLQSLRASIEAELDFSDQDDVPESADLTDEIAALAGEMKRFESGLRDAEIVRQGFRVAIVGAPNAGKSSLLNALAKRDVAIVTSEPGTTRDLIEVSLDLGGYKVILTDTAGLRDASSEAERIGVERARDAARSADLVLLVREPGGADVAVDSSRRTIRIASKVDLGNAVDFDIAISVATGEGIDMLIERLKMELEAGGARRNGLPVTARQAGYVRRAEAHLGDALAAPLPELRAEHLRLAAEEIGRVVGIGDTEDMLGEIFGRFCIGK